MIKTITMHRYTTFRSSQIKDSKSTVSTHGQRKKATKIKMVPKFFTTKTKNKEVPVVQIKNLMRGT